MSVKIIGNPLGRLRDSRINMPKVKLQTFRQIGGALKKSAIEGIESPPKTGRIYSFNGRRHQASAPGEYPANMTGALKNSISYNIYNTTAMQFGSKISYGKYLQDGTWKMMPRPFLTKAHDRIEPSFINTMSIMMYRYL